jgi:hypothetical protein
MLDWTPSNRPTFDEIYGLLEQEEYWLPGTDRSEFLKYVKDLKREEGRISLESATDCLQLLRQVAFASDLADFLGCIKYDDAFDRVTNKLIEGLGFLCGTEGKLNTDVVETIRALMAKEKWLGPVAINRAARESLNPEQPIS